MANFDNIHSPPTVQTDSTIVLCTLNAKYIHASLGLRYLFANMGDLQSQTRICEYMINRKSPQEWANELIAMNPRIIGFGVYIWNTVQTCELVKLLKQQRPDITIVLGGPEVSHETMDQEIAQLSDFIITGWGDISFPKLCRAVLHGPQPLMKVIAGEQPPLDDIQLPYAYYTDEDLAHRLLYVEASRGCPFKCEFCISSLDKTAWAFDLDLFLNELQTLYNRGARNFKFVDRTFNLKIDASVRIMQFFLEKIIDEKHGRGLEFSDEPPLGELAPLGGSAVREATSVGALFLHFEVIPDHLPDRLKEMIAKFPPGSLQFEVGIQTFNVEVQKRISRKQDNDKTIANLKWLLNESNAHLHTDLIFGLPGESLQSFADGFDKLYALEPHEIQLGILKRLRGTPIAKHTETHGMVYDPLPPYQVRETAAVTAADMTRFAHMARYWDLVANSGRFTATMPLLMQGGSPFGAFMAFSDWLWHDSPQIQGKTSGITPEHLVNALHAYLVGPRGMDADVVTQALLADYVASGARARPDVLRHLMPKFPAPIPKAKKQHSQRQAQHLATASS